MSKWYAENLRSRVEEVFPTFMSFCGILRDLKCSNFDITRYNYFEILFESIWRLWNFLGMNLDIFKFRIERWFTVRNSRATRRQIHVQKTLYNGAILRPQQFCFHFPTNFPRFFIPILTVMKFNSVTNKIEYHRY